MDVGSFRRRRLGGGRVDLGYGGRERGEDEGEGEARAAVLVRRSMVTAVVAEDRSAREIGIGPLDLYIQSRVVLATAWAECLFFSESKLLTLPTSSSVSTPW